MSLSLLIFKQHKAKINFHMCSEVLRRFWQGLRSGGDLWGYLANNRIPQTCSYLKHNPSIPGFFIFINQLDNQLVEVRSGVSYS